MSTEVKIESQAVTPIMTMLVVFGMVSVYAMMCQSRMEFWNPVFESFAQSNCSIQAVTVGSAVNNQDWMALAKLFPIASLASLTGWQLVANSYFFWIFGSTIEQKLGAGRFLLCTLLFMVAPYAALSYNVMKTVDSHYFLGPAYLILAMMSAGMVFPEEKKIRQWFKKSRGEIFNRKAEGDMTSKFKFNTKLFTMIFILYEAGLWFYTTKFTPSFQTIELYGAATAVILGYGITYFMVWSATGDLREGPVKLMCIRKYNDILKLDVGHEAAVKSTSMALGLPEDRVRQWVAKQRGKMKVS